MAYRAKWTDHPLERMVIYSGSLKTPTISRDQHKLYAQLTIDTNEAAAVRFLKSFTLLHHRLSLPLQPI